jgi:hypothetical protein
MAAVKKVFNKIQNLVGDNHIFKEYDVGKQAASGGEPLLLSHTAGSIHHAQALGSTGAFTMPSTRAPSRYGSSCWWVFGMFG